MDPMDENMEMSPSDISDTLDVAETDTVVVDSKADADSSNAGGSEDDTLSIVRDVVQPKSEEAASPAEQEAQAEQPTDAEPTKEHDDSYTDVPFNKHPRFQTLLKERNEFKQDAARYRNVQTFMDSNGITAEEAADGFDVMAKLKTDPHAAWEKLKPIVQNLLTVIGEVLPNELAQRVEAGELSREAAFEISRAQAKATSVENRQSFFEQQTARRMAEKHAQSLYDAASDWEGDRKLKDPNFASKFDALQKELVFIHHREGKANTPDGVRDQLNRAYKAVTVAAPAPAPAPQRKQPITSQATSSASASSSTAPKPASTLDIIRAERAKRTG